MANSILQSILEGITNGGVSDVLTGAAKGALTSRQGDDYLKLALADRKLNQAKFAESAPGTRLSTALRSSIAGGGFKPTSVSWGGPGSGLRGELPTYSGGIRDALNTASANPQVKELGNTITADELARQKTGGATGGNQDMSVGTAANVGQSSILEKVLGAGGLGSSLASALKNGGGNGGSFDLDKLLSKLFGGGGGGGINDWQGPSYGNADYGPTLEELLGNGNEGDWTEEPMSGGGNGASADDWLDE